MVPEGADPISFPLAIGDRGRNTYGSARTYPRLAILKYTPHTSSVEGRIMRRREAGRGAAPAGSCT